MLCDFGCGANAIKRFGSGKWCCSKSSSSCPAMKAKNRSKHVDNSLNWNEIQVVYDEGYSLRDIGVKFSVEQGTLRGAINRGELIVRSRKDATLLARQNGKGTLSDEGRAKLEVGARNRIVERYEQGWLPKAGRCKKYKYISPFAGEVSLDGTWELEVAKWLDKNEFNWKRNTKRFQYINLKNKLSFYTPDFWVEQLGGYLEIKGYETALDRCKWSQFTESLIVWKEKELKEYGVLP